jgi:hypothetical protein
MIRTPFSKTQVIYQEAAEDDAPNEAIVVHVDNGGTICITQREADIVINAGAVPELCKVLKKLASEAS